MTKIRNSQTKNISKLIHYLDTWIKSVKNEKGTEKHALNSNVDKCRHFQNILQCQSYHRLNY